MQNVKSARVQTFPSILDFLRCKVEHAWWITLYVSYSTGEPTQSFTTWLSSHEVNYQQIKSLQTHRNNLKCSEIYDPVSSHKRRFKINLCRNENAKTQLKLWACGINRLDVESHHNTGQSEAWKKSNRRYVQGLTGSCPKPHCWCRGRYCINLWANI